MQQSKESGLGVCAKFQVTGFMRNDDEMLKSRFVDVRGKVGRIIRVSH